MANYLSRLFYLGNRFHGSQYQPGLATVQGELIEALTSWSGEHHSTQTVQLSGRTDRGVHSIGQLVMFTTEERFSIDKINRHLPDDIILWASTEAPVNFVPRYDVLMRHYRYYLDKSWTDLNLEVVKKAAALLIGSNDFNRLAKPDAGRNTITTILNISFHDYNGTYFLDIFGTRFLWKLVRKMVTLLIEIGTERIKLDIINKILSGQKGLAGGIQPAPPENLVLVETIVPFKIKTSKYAIRMIQKQLSDQLEQYRRSIRTVNNVIDYFSEPMKTSQHSTKSRNRSDSLDLS
ncbi:MAG: tRNA pseudouridine(38-40) synthase TruA [Candidatus Thorarchaeota archaeon]|jgi:tRNA pseudouridine38-40 synthase